MNKHFDRKPSAPIHIAHDDSLIMTRIDLHSEAASKKISLITMIIIVVALSLVSGCANYGSARMEQQAEPVASVYLVRKAGDQCEALNEEIEETLAYSEKYKRSPLANRHNAIALDKLTKIERRANMAGCTFASHPPGTRLHHLSLL